MTWPSVTFKEMCAKLDAKSRKKVSRQLLEPEFVKKTKLLAAFVRNRDGREVGPEWARN